MFIILQGQANAKMISNNFMFKIEVFCISTLWLTPEEEVGALNMDCSIKTNQNFFPILQEVIDIFGPMCCWSHSNNEKMAINKTCACFSDKSFIFFCIYGFYGV